MTAAAVAFHALGDPIRLEMVERISRAQPCPIATVLHGFGITRQGARKHLQVLVDAKLVVLEPRGREVHAQLAVAGLAQTKAFLEKLERQWDRRLAALKRFVEGG